MSDPDPFVRAAELEGVPSTLAAARDSVDALLADRGLRRTTPEQTTESLLMGAHASACLAGSASSLEDLRAGTADAVAMRAARLYAELLGLAPVLSRSPLQALARMHTLAEAGAVEDADLGRPRTVAGAAEGLQRLSRELVGHQTAPAVAVAALAHAEVATTEPFEGGNGLVGRALERLVLVVRGVDQASLVVPEAGHLSMRDDYEAALVAYRTEGLAGQRVWLLHCAQALAEGVSHSPVR